MKVKVSNYIAEFLTKHDIDTVFTVTGGGAMHLNDGLGHQEGLHCVYQHHEQACAIAAESYARIHNRIAAVCVTTGPGGTNAITGVLGGWLDSIPMLILSGQVRYDTTARSTGLKLRAVGDQEFDITTAVASMTKYCEMVIDPRRIRYCLEKALFLAKTGRPGPCWLDIPVNVQGAYVEEEEMIGFDPAECGSEVPKKVSDEVLDAILEKIKEARRPVINAGSAIRTSGGYEVFRRLVEKLQIPVVTGWNSIDLIETEHPLYVGRGGNMGDRAGNFAVQNSDLVLSLGSRLSIRQVGFNWKTWAREAYKIIVDVDENELRKPTISPDMAVCADVRDVMEGLERRLSEGWLQNQRKDGQAEDGQSEAGSRAGVPWQDWLARCAHWKEAYPVVQKKHYKDRDKTNVYAFIDSLSRALPEDMITVVGNGSACVVGSHGYYIKKNSRFIINSAVASMGYDLPAAIGACVADGGRELVCITGDGSIQMNLQELQTILTNRLPVKLFVINNQGYHSIRQTQKNFFGEPLVGIGTDSGDLSFPSMGKLAWAYGYPYCCCEKNEDLDWVIEQMLERKGPAICEIMVGIEQMFEPKSATKRLEDGTLVSPPLEDLAPFLPREEFYENMIIAPIEET